MPLRFGVFEADLQSGELRKAGVRVRLNRQSFELLAVLIEHAGEVVTREDLRARLWGSDTFVDFDVGLNTAMKKLRAALADSPEAPRYVETVPRKGYRFIGSINRSEEATAQKPRRISRWLVLAACALAGIIGLGVVLRARRAPAHIRSIAVLPLDNLSGDPAQESFVDAVTDALITDLAEINTLRVISRTSAMRYKHTHESLPEIGRELNVDAIVEGTVVRSAQRVRVDAHLVQASSDHDLWAGTYERSLGDVVALQSDVARAIADAIEIQLTPQEHARLARRQTVNPEAFELYLRGRYFLDKWTDAGCRKATDYFQQAIQRDPNYALAYAGLAEASLLREDISPREAFSRSKEMARAALQIDAGLPEAHNALAMSIFLYDWNWIAAEKEFQRALAINPNYAMAHQFYGQFQKAMGRQDWAAQVRRARTLDPLSVIIAGVGQYRASGRYDLAIENMRKKIELEPDSPGLYRQLGDIYVRIGKYREAEAQYEKGFDVSGGNPQDLARVGYTYGLEGRQSDALKVLDQMAALSKRRYVSSFDVALVYAGVGDKNAAFDWLEKALAERSTDLVFLKWDDKLASLRPDPRYSELVGRVGLPQ